MADMFRPTKDTAWQYGAPPGATGMGVTDYNKQVVSGMYQNLLGREPEPGAVESWLSNPGFKDFQSIESAIKGSQESFGTKYAGGGNTEKWIRELYGSQLPQVQSSIKSQAVGGGLDTGGYYTALAKAETGNWQDMMRALIQNTQYQQQLSSGRQQFEKTFAESQRQFNVGQETQREIAERGYQVGTAQLQAQQPSAWETILSGAAAGSAFGPWGAGFGALLGWGAKQGLFG